MRRKSRERFEVNARKSLKRTALGRLHSRLVEHPSRDLTARTSPQFPGVASDVYAFKESTLRPRVQSRSAFSVTR